MGFRFNFPVLRSILVAGLSVMLVRCAANLSDAKLNDDRGGRLKPSSLEGGASPNDQAPPKVPNDRKYDALAFPTFPPGRVAFTRLPIDPDADPDQKYPDPVKPTPTPVLCTTDEQCEAPDYCLRPQGSMGPGGACGQAFHTSGAALAEVRYVKGCQVDAECPGKFACVLVNGPWGLCVKMEAIEAPAK